MGGAASRASRCSQRPARARSTRARRRSSTCARPPSRRSTSNGIAGRLAARCRRPCCRSQAEANLSIRLAPRPGRRSRSRPRSSSCCARRPPRAPSVELSAALVRAPGARPAGRAGRSSSPRTPSSRRWAAARCSCAPAARCRSCRRSSTRASRRSSPASHAREQHPLAERAAARRVHAARDRDGEGALPAAGGARRASGGSPSTSQACPKRRISSMIGSSASPFSVSSYSTRGGDSA